MITTNDLRNQIKNFIDDTDKYTIKNILDMLEIKQTSVWWSNEPTEDAWTESASIDEANEEKQLTYEELKKQYPDWFKE